MGSRAVSWAKERVSDISDKNIVFIAAAKVGYSDADIYIMYHVYIGQHYSFTHVDCTTSTSVYICMCMYEPSLAMQNCTAAQ